MNSGTSSSSRSPSLIRARPREGRLSVSSQVHAAPTVGEATIGKWREAGLLKPSVLKPLLATIEQGLVLRKLGRLEKEDRRALRKVLDDILGQ